MHSNTLTSREMISNIDIKLKEFIIHCSVAPSNNSLYRLSFFCKQIKEHCLSPWLRHNRITPGSGMLYAPFLDDITNAANDPLNPPAAKQYAKKIVQDLQSLAVHINRQSSNAGVNFTDDNITAGNRLLSPTILLNTDSRDMIFSRGVDLQDYDNKIPALAEYNLNDEESCLSRPFTAFFRLICS